MLGGKPTTTSVEHNIISHQHSCPFGSFLVIQKPAGEETLAHGPNKIGHNREKWDWIISEKKTHRIPTTVRIIDMAQGSQTQFAWGLLEAEAG